MNRDNIDSINTINNAIKNGDELAWRKIYSQYYHAIANCIRKDLSRRGKNDGILEDLIHQTFLRIVTANKKPTFENIRQFYAWLIKAARTEVIDYFRNNSQKSDDLLIYSEDIELLSVDIPASGNSKSPTDIKVSRILSLMSEKENLLLRMRAEGTEYKLIAEELCIQENVARTYYQRAALKFKKLYLDNSE